MATPVAVSRTPRGRFSSSIASNAILRSCGRETSQDRTNSTNFDSAVIVTGYAYPAVAGPPNHLRNCRPRRVGTNPRVELQARPAVVPSEEGGGQAFTHPRVQPQRQVPRRGVSRADGGLGPPESAPFHASLS